MGTYVRSKKSPRRSVSETLLDAESEHFLDCPEADIASRVGALLLDIIFLSLFGSAIENFFLALAPYFQLVAKTVGVSAVQIFLLRGPEVLAVFVLTGKILLVYFYVIWSLTQFGGTPGKLLLGLRLVDEKTGRCLSFLRVLAREIGLKGGMLGMGFVLALIRKDRRALHDVMVGSTVKRIRGNP